MENNSCFCEFNSPEAVMGEGLNGLPPYRQIQSELVDDYENCPNSWMKSDSKIKSYFVGVEKKHGMWLDFNKCRSHEHDIAILISIQGINPITGLVYEDKLIHHLDNCPKCNKPFGLNRHCEDCGYQWPKQNYLCTTGTPDGRLWLDGFRTIDGEIRQYVFTDEIIKGVAANIIGDKRVFAIGISFFKSKEKKKFNPIYGNGYKFKYKHGKSDWTLTKTGDIPDDVPEITWDDVPGITWISQQDKNTHDINFISSNTGVAESAYYCQTSLTCDSNARGILRGNTKSVNFKSNLTFDEPTQIEIGAGNKINQKIYDDPKDLNYWEEEPIAKICINYCAKELFDEITSSGKRDYNKNKDGFLKGIGCAV
jgi:hypothetical protein